jgi:DNA-directed RNA polymerase specialized sigma24 family protein
MTTATIKTSRDQSLYIEQVFENHCPRLRHYFLRQTGNTSLADDCVRETMSRFFIFMKDRDWTEEMEAIPGYLLRIAAILCSEKLTERSQDPSRPVSHENKSLFNKMTDEAIQTGRERIQYKQFLLRPGEGNRGLSTMA